MTDDLPISGFGVRGFRTLSDATLVCDGRLTVVCGQNNAGKSSLLDALRRYPACIAAVKGRGIRRGTDLESFGEPGTTARFAISPLGAPMLRAAEKAGLPIDRLEATKDVVAGHLPFGRLWVDVKQEEKNVVVAGYAGARDSLRSAIDALSPPDQKPWTNLVRKLSGQDVRPFDLNQQFFRSILESTDPKIVYVPDVRRSADEPLSPEDLGVLAKASSLRANGSRQEEWTETLAWVLKDTFGPDVVYHVPPEGASGIFRLSIDDQEDLRLDHVGAGVREVVAVVYQALRSGDGTVLLIEEPENCLHPLAVRRLLHSLTTRAGLQVIATTHSSAVIDSNPDALIRVARSASGSEANPITSPADRFEAIRSLGYSPADVVLAPCAVWVEGPSDRIYLRTWLSNEDLVEGIDYQIMYYGGALGSRVGLDHEPDDEALTSLRVLSRRCVVVADSDRKTARGRLKPHVSRWRKEIEGDDHAHLWITPGKEIENVLPLTLINEYRASKKRKKMTENSKRFGDVFEGIKNPRKVQLAGWIIERDRETPAEAQQAVSRMASFVRMSRDRSSGLS